MQEAPPSRSRSASWWKLLLKIVVTAFCIWYISGKIDFKKAGNALGQVNWWPLLLALLSYIISKLVAALRLNIYFRNIDIHMPERQNVRLYWLGMFYNLFLPGSVSGDAYKVILLTKKYNIPYKKITAAVLLDRFSGLLGLGLILSVFGFLALDKMQYSALLAAGSLTATIVVYLVIKKWFGDFLPGFMPTLFLGITVQCLQVICAYEILCALGISLSITAYIFLFLASSVVSVLPLTIGGLGIRELAFLEGAHYFGLQKETVVVISIIFYLITLFISAVGLIYVFRDPLKEKVGSS